MTSLGAFSPDSPQTIPLVNSETPLPFTLKPILSPGYPSFNYSLCLSTLLTYTPVNYPFFPFFSLYGAKVTFIPFLMIPVSTLPAGTVPTPLILYTS